MEKVQRNALFEAIVTGGLDPIECHLDERNSIFRDGTASVIHQQSQSYFRLIKSSSGPAASPERTIYLWRRVVENGPRTRGRVLGWPAVVKLVGQWAKEVNAPDLWFGLRNTKMSLGGAQEGNSENTPFTIGEQLQISTKLREIKAYVKETYQLSDEEFARIEERLDEAEEASRRVGRKDWVLLFSGLALTLIVTDLVTPGVAQHILTMTLHGLRHLFGGGAKPISGPH